MDIQSKKSFDASLTSLRSTPIIESHPTFEDIQLAYKKLQALRSESSNMNSYTSLGVKGRCSSTVSNNDGIENQHQATPCNNFIPHEYEHPNSLQKKEISSNKVINYRGPLSTGSNTPTFPNVQNVSTLLSLQEFVKKSNTKKKPHIQKDCSLDVSKECQVDDQSTRRLMNKLKNLDEILQNLDQSLSNKIKTTSLMAPLLEDNYLASNLKLSDRIYPILKDAHTLEEVNNNLSILSANTRLQSATHHCLTNPKNNSGLAQMTNAQTLSILDSKTSTNLKGGSNCGVENSWTGSESSGATHVPQSFSTPVTNRSMDDIPLLMSKFANFTNQTPVSSYVEETAIKELVGLIEKLILQRTQNSRRARQWVITTMLYNCKSNI
ncbi:hypothetical protein M758_3G165100 [Ceratodon purpureus]|nr:hypothetical protein M758_3G165100 [Ceratodon purpureus]